MLQQPNQMMIEEEEAVEAELIRLGFVKIESLILTEETTDLAIEETLASDEVVLEAIEETEETEEVLEAIEETEVEDMVVKEIIDLEATEQKDLVKEEGTETIDLEATETIDLEATEEGTETIDLEVTEEGTEDLAVVIEGTDLATVIVKGLKGIKDQKNQFHQGNQGNQDNQDHLLLEKPSPEMKLNTFDLQQLPPKVGKLKPNMKPRRRLLQPQQGNLSILLQLSTMHLGHEDLALSKQKSQIDLVKILQEIRTLKDQKEKLKQ